MQFRLKVRDVQVIERLSLELDLEENKLTCLVGRNGVGKTTLVRAIKNLSEADTFLNSAPPNIFVHASKICYWADFERVVFEYDLDNRGLNLKHLIKFYKMANILLYSLCSSSSAANSSINGRNRCVGQLGICSYSMSPCRNNE